MTYRPDAQRHWRSVRAVLLSLYIFPINQLFVLLLLPGAVCREARRPYFRTQTITKYEECAYEDIVFLAPRLGALERCPACRLC